MLRSLQAIVLIASLAVAGVSVAGCYGGGIGNAGRIDYVRVYPAYTQNDFAYGAAGRDMTTDILGNPFQGVAQADFDAAVTSAMQGAHFGPPTNFTTMPGDSARPVYRVRLLWNGPRATNGNTLCTDAPVEGGGSEADGTARLVAAYCRSDRAATYLVGSISEVSGPDDPRFIGFVRQATARLFPPKDGIFDPDRCFVPDC